MKFNTNMHVLPLGLLTGSVALLMTTAASAVVVFQGGSIHTGANWIDDADGSTGLPTTGDTATIAVDGTIVSGTTNFASATITQTAGTLTSAAQNINLNFNGTGTYNLEGGSLVLRGLQANGSSSTINLIGGLVRLGTTTNTGIGFGVNNGGTLNIGGSAVIEADREITNQFNTGDFNFAADWTGSFTVVGFENPGGFQNLVQEFGANFDGTEVTDANFADFFELSSDGLTITAIPEPSSIALLGLASLGLLRRRK